MYKKAAYGASVVLAALIGMPMAGASDDSVSPRVMKQYRDICVSMYNSALIETGEMALVASPQVVEKASQRRADHHGAASKLGSVTALGVSNVTHLTSADVFICQFVHESGISLWQLAYSPMTHVVEDYEVEFLIPETRTAQPAPRRARTTEASGDETRPAVQPAETETAPDAPTQSEACKMFPDLC